MDRSDVKKKSVGSPGLGLVKPTREALVEDMYALIGLELRSQKERSVTGELSDKDIGRFQKVTDAFIKLEKEQRAFEEATSPEHLSDEELLDAMKRGGDVLQARVLVTGEDEDRCLDYGVDDEDDEEL